MCDNLRKKASHICVIPQKDQSQLRLLVVVNKAKFNLVYARCRTHHIHTHITQINQIVVSKSPLFKSLTSLLGPILWGSVSQSTQDYRVGSDTICNNPRKSASHICAIPQKYQSQLRLLVVVNKAQFNLVYARCRTHHIPTHITQINQIGASHHALLWFCISYCILICCFHHLKFVSTQGSKFPSTFGFIIEVKNLQILICINLLNSIYSLEV